MSQVHDPLMARFAPSPSESTSFVGRARELEDCRRALSRASLLTISGPGGAGKTRLALRLMHSARRVFSDGVWFIPLEGLALDSDAASVADTVSSTMRLSTPDSSVEVLIDSIGSRHVLLVLDNCEHVLPAARQLIARLLSECEHLRIVTTSREVLGLPGEELVPISALGDGPGDSSALFLDRARAAVPGFTPTLEDKQTIVRICDRLDRLPLAIELAAARVRSLSVRDILDRLEDPLHLLGRGSGGAVGRQSTLRNSINWSFELCTDGEREMWAQLSVFAGPFDIAAVEAVVDLEVHGSAGLLDVVHSLIEKSLVTVFHADGDVWYSMLVPIREFGAELLGDSDGFDNALRRLRAWCVSQLLRAERDWIGPNQAWWIRYFRRELPNVRTALEFSLRTEGEVEAALELTTIAWRVAWFAGGRRGEHREWLAKALAASAGRSSSVRAQALLLDAALAANVGDNDRAAASLQQAEFAVAQLGSPMLDAILGSARAMVYPESDEAAHLQAVMASWEAREPWLTARVNGKIQAAVAYQRAGQMDRVERVLDEYLAVHRDTGELYEAGEALLLTAAWSLLAGDVPLAISRARQSLSLRERLQNPSDLGPVFGVLALAAAKQKHADDAAALLGAADEMWSIGGSVPSTALALRIRSEATAATEALLSTSAFTRAYASGRSLTEKDAVAFALGERPEVAARSHQGAQASPLTRRQTEVAALVARGLSDKQIAATLFISTRTAESHVQNALRTLGFTTRTELGVWSAQATGT